MVVFTVSGVKSVDAGPCWFLYREGFECVDVRRLRERFYMRAQRSLREDGMGVMQAIIVRALRTPRISGSTAVAPVAFRDQQCQNQTSRRHSMSKQ